MVANITKSENQREKNVQNPPYLGLCECLSFFSLWTIGLSVCDLQRYDRKSYIVRHVESTERGETALLIPSNNSARRTRRDLCLLLIFIYTRPFIGGTGMGTLLFRTGLDAIYQSIFSPPFTWISPRHCRKRKLNILQNVPVDPAVVAAATQYLENESTLELAHLRKREIKRGRPGISVSFSWRKGQYCIRAELEQTTARNRLSKTRKQTLNTYDFDIRKKRGKKLCAAVEIDTN